VVPCGVDAARFRADPAAPRTAADWRAPSGGARVVTLGRLVPRKGVDTVIAALAQVPDAQLIVAGGPAADQLDRDPEVRRLRGCARAAGVGDRVVFAGRVRHDDVPELLRSADVVVSDPWYEPFGIVPLEAMACGSAVVASAVGGHLDTVQDGVTGLLVPPRDPGALAERIARLLAQPRLRAELGGAGLRRVRTRYSWDQIAAETESVYERVVRVPQGVLSGSAVPR
jgi:glycosyltransferase involved in cell wall biosynthesis